MIKCLFGHKWDGCVCRRCGKLRDEEHDWDGCKCRRCGATRDEEHTWDGCLCRRCRRIRPDGHDWNGCTCIRCGIVSHDIKDCRCTRCGKEFHDFRDENGYAPEQNSTGGYFPCTRCGAVFRRTFTRPDCSLCGGSGYYEAYSSQSGCCHSWQQECEYCKDVVPEIKEWIEYPDTGA